MVGYEELGDETEIDEQFKNHCEISAQMRLTKSGIMSFFKGQLQVFPKFAPATQPMKTQMLSILDSSAPAGENTTFLIRMVFAKQASNIDFFLKAFYDVSVRK